MTDLAAILAEAGARRAQAPTPKPQAALKGKAAPPADPRTVKDTVTLTDGGQKIVNLNRGNELAAEFRAKPVDKDYLASLSRAQEDVRRIGQLFAETIKALFAQSRK